MNSEATSMLVYWSMFLLPVIALILPLRGSTSVRCISYLLIGIYYTILIGLRYEVGGDWSAYLEHYQSASGMALFDYLSIMGWRDPAYYIINWLANVIGGGIYLVNLACGAIAVSGLIIFCRKMPLAWLGIAIGVPYYLIVVSMGYTRQSAAIGLFMMALSQFLDQNVWRCLLLLVLAAAFHISALIMLPVFALSYSDRSRLRLWIAAVGVVVLFGLIFAQRIAALWNIYVLSGLLHSEGGLIRVMMSALPGLLLIIFNRKLLLDETHPKLWIVMAIVALICVPLVNFFSTAIDRIALYLIPLQIFVFTRLHRILTNRHLRIAMVLMVIFYYAAVLWVWLNFATHSEEWIPYQFALCLD